MLGTIFNIQRFSLFDGPGVRTVVFLKGCPLKCIWCHNPEGLEKKLQIMYDPTRCIGCGECAASCPQHTIEMRKNKNGKRYAHIVRKDCIRCFCCQELCPFIAIDTKKNFILSIITKFN